MAEKEVSGGVLQNMEDNRWGAMDGIEIPLNIEPPINAIQEFLEKVNALLEVTLAILDFIKAFMTNFLNPLLALVKKIIQLIKDLINDIKQLGFYMTSDLGILKSRDWAQLDNGYSSFERRMVSRLTDTSDINRPNFSANSACIAVYLYMDTEAMADMWKIIKTLKKIWGYLTGEWVGGGGLPQPVKALAVPTKKRKYLSEPEDVIRLSWNMAKGKGTGARPPVGGFLIEASTLPQGFLLAYETNAPNPQKKNKKLIPLKGFATDSEGKPLRVFGGYYTIANLHNGIFDHYHEYFLIKDTTDTTRLKIRAFPFETSGTRPLMQTALVYDSGLLKSYSNSFSIEIPISVLPLEGEIVKNGDKYEVELVGLSSKVHFRITALTPDGVEIAKGQKVEGTKLYRFPKVSWGLLTGAGKITCLPLEVRQKRIPAYYLTKSAVGIGTESARIETSPSTVCSSTIPNELEGFVRLCKNVLLSVILKGTEYIKDNPKTFKNTYQTNAQLELCSLMKKVINPLMFNNVHTTKYRKKWSKSGKSMVAFRQDLLLRIELTIEAALKNMTIPLNLQEMLLEKSNELKGKQGWCYQKNIDSLFPWNMQDIKKGPIEYPYPDYERFATDSNDQALGNDTFADNMGYTTTDCDLLSLLESDDDAKYAGNYGIFPTLKAIWRNLSNKDKAAMEDLNEGWLLDFKRYGQDFYTMAEMEKIYSTATYEAGSTFEEVELNMPAFVWWSDNQSLATSTDLQTGKRLTEWSWMTCPLGNGVGELSLTILNLLFGGYGEKGEGEWKSLRFFEEGLPQFENFANKVINWMETLEEKLEAFIKNILAAIEKIEAKIASLQQLIADIDSLLEKLKGFKIELELPMNMLIHTANGTDDLLTKLVTAQDKPVTGEPETKSFGMLLVAGGVPSILIELIMSLWSTPEEVIEAEYDFDA